MKYLAMYVGLGFLLAMQAVARSRNARYELRKRPLETLTNWVGVIMLWSSVLLAEFCEWWKDRP